MKKKLLIERNLNTKGLDYHHKLTNEMGIKVKNVGDYYLYRYNQLDDNCDFSKIITQECRSIIFKYNGNSQPQKELDILQNSQLEIKPQFERVCVPFYKFFNYNEPIAKNLYEKMKFKKLYAYEKIDGAMVTVWYDKKWHVSTSGNIDALQAPISNPLSPYDTYGEMFISCAARQHLDFNKLDKDCTYIFEMIGKYIRIVVPYTEDKIYHIATRNNKTLKENFDYIGIEQPKCYIMENMYEAMKHIEKLTLDDENFEGLVVRDNQFNRLKIKPDIYFHLSTLKNNGDITPKRIMSMIMNGDDTEFLAYFPEYSDDVNSFKTKMNNCCKQLENEIVQLLKNENVCKPQNRKYLAVRLKGNELCGFLLTAAGEIYKENLTFDNYKEYVQDVLNKMYQNQRKSYVNLIDKF